jgi:hypothetical protein
MALSLFAIFKRELLHYHAELMRGARANTAGTLNRETPQRGPYSAFPAAGPAPCPIQRMEQARCELTCVPRYTPRPR